MGTFAPKQSEPQPAPSQGLAPPVSAASVAGQQTHPVLRLQQTLGNRAVLRVLRKKDPGPGELSLDQAAWKRFAEARAANATDQAIAAVEELIASPIEDTGKWAEQGVDLALWLFDKGRADLARRALGATDTALRTGGTVSCPPMGKGLREAVAPDDPVKLLERAKATARVGQHDLAFQLFGLAFRIFQMQLQAITEYRNRLDKMPFYAKTYRSATYETAQDIYDRMREILGFYRVLAREARDAGNDDLARSRSHLATLLAGTIEKDFAVTRDVLTLERTRMGTEEEQVLRVHGVNKAETDLKKLPGGDPLAKSPRDVKTPLQDTRKALGLQAALLAELQDDPEVRREFGTTAIDMNNPAHRLRVWSARLRSRGVRGATSMSPLSDLLKFIERYLGAFTTHSEFSIRDVGTSYLDSTLPTDLIGRIVQDCGVYALTVAWEIFKTARDAKLGRIEFELFFSPNHVVLIMRHADSKETFVVSNNDIVKTTSDPKDENTAIGTQFARLGTTFGRPARAGSTDLPEKEFRKKLWETYVKDGVGFGPAPLEGRGDKRSEKQRIEATASGFYETQRQFDEKQEALRAALDAFDAERKPGNEADLFARRLPELDRAGRELGELYVKIREVAKGLPGAKVIPKRPPTGSPPLVRIALLLLQHAQLSNAPLDKGGSELIQMVAAVYEALGVPEAAELRNHLRFRQK